MHPPFQIDLRSLSPEGKHLIGHLPASFFQLPENDLTQAVSPLNYDLRVVKDDKDLIIVGSMDATFSLECGRCLQRFQIEVDLPDYASEVPIENETTIDLTELIREDILLTLPNYPRCEDGNIEPRECPAEGKFDKAAASAEADEPQGAGKDAWNALDQLK